MMLIPNPADQLHETVMPTVALLASMLLQLVAACSYLKQLLIQTANKLSC